MIKVDIEGENRVTNLVVRALLQGPLVHLLSGLLVPFALFEVLIGSCLLQSEASKEVPENHMIDKE